MTEQERDAIIKAKRAKITALRQQMREHGERAGVWRCYCSDCNLAERELIALLKGEKTE